MNKADQIIKTEEFVRENLKNYDSGHDWWHIERVRKLAKYINESEGSVDPFVLDITVLLHDSADSKFTGDDIEQGYYNISMFLDENELDEVSARIMNVIRNSSFSKKNPSGDLKDPLLLILQDADRLDAIGAIGIARAFNYGGYRNNPIYDPDNKGKSTIQHFNEKLLLLKSGMNTESAKQLAEKRHECLEKFLSEFYKEWDFDEM
jgi:uncharacterized protein